MTTLTPSNTEDGKMLVDFDLSQFPCKIEIPSNTTFPINNASITVIVNINGIESSIKYPLTMEMYNSEK